MRKQIEYKENTKLPFRLRFYKLFKEQPNLIRLNKTSNQFNTPILKVSFMKDFLNETDAYLDSPLNNPYKDQMVSQFKTYNLNKVRFCKRLDESVNECENMNALTKPISLINNYHPCKNRLSKRRDKLVQINQLLQLSERKTENESNEEFSKQIELLGDRWREQPSLCVSSGRRKSIKFDESALNDTNEHQLLGGKYEVKQRATSKALEVLKHYLDQRSENSVKNRLKNLEENHPFLNKSLFVFKPSNWFRKKCIQIIEFKLNLKLFIRSILLRRSSLYKNRVLILKNYSFFKEQFRKLNNLIYSLPVVDWIMILITFICCFPLMFENPNYSILNDKKIILIEYLFISTLFLDIGIRLAANGFFTPTSTLFNLSFLVDLIVLINSVVLILFHHFNIQIPLTILILRLSFKHSIRIRSSLIRIKFHKI